MIRPSIKLPLWAAVALPAAAYVVRSLIRGSFALDLPLDLVAYALLAFVVIAVGIGRARLAHEPDDEGADQIDDDHEGADGEREHDDVGHEVG
jgi:hypothetical protein